jgi:hypothetical protein
MAFCAIPVAFLFWLFVTGAYAGIPIHVFLLAGQSNMVGFTPVQGLPSDLSAPQNQVIFFGDGEIDASLKKRWLTNGVDLGYGKGLFGPELLFGKTLSDSLPAQQFALIKYSIGGTSLASDWRPPRSGGRIGPLFKNMVSTIQAAVAGLGPQYEPQWAGILWMQGEFDSGNREFAEEYERNLSNLIQDTRSLLGDSRIPFLIGMVDSSRNWTHVGMVRNAERKVSAAQSSIGIFDTKGFDTDGTHYKKDGMVALGRAFAVTYLNGFSNQSYALVDINGIFEPVNGEPSFVKVREDIQPSWRLALSSNYRIDGRRIFIRP